MRKTPQDMAVGLTYTHEKYGKYQIVNYDTVCRVSVKFLDTGYVGTFTAVNIRENYIRDKKHIPEKFKIGTRYSTNHGDLVITSYDSRKNVGVRFLETGCEKVVRGDYITSGSITDYLRPTAYGVGYLGSDKKSKTKIEKLAHKRWNHMLERCYSDRWHAAKPTYANCEVCEEWKNLSVFTDWFVDNYPNDGKEYHLDKDIKVKGNKLYSPETCLFVTPEENSMQRNGTANKYFVLSHHKYGIRYVRNLSNLAREFEIKPNGLSYLINGHKKTYRGWKMIRSHYTPYLEDATL